MSIKILTAMLCFALALPPTMDLSGLGQADAKPSKQELKKKEAKKKKAKEEQAKEKEPKKGAKNEKEPKTKQGRLRLLQPSGAAAGAAAGAAGQALLPEPIVDDANRALGIAQHLCLVGSRINFSLDVGGRLNVSKRSPHGTVTASVNATSVEGAVLFENEEIRRLIEIDIRKCMVEQWPSVLKILRKGTQ